VKINFKEQFGNTEFKMANLRLHVIEIHSRVQIPIGHYMCIRTGVKFYYELTNSLTN
jgi:hypothetical protein